MTKTIILIGKTGSGKSTLANVISGTNKFKESGSSISATKEIQSEEFTEGNVNHAIIDTVGIGDTKLTRNEVLDKIAEAVYLARDGVSQVLFVIDGRFDQNEMSIYNLLKTIIFDKNITDYTTITRTNFDNFRRSKMCKNDVSLMVEKGSELAKIIESCQRRVIHIDNPSLEVKDAGKLDRNKNKRSKSREILFEHLNKVCQEVPYKPPKLQSLSEAIVTYMEEKIRKRKKLEEKEKNLGLEEIYEEKKVISNPDITTVASSKNDNFRKENNKNEMIVEKLKKQTDSRRGSENNDEKEIIEQKITKLEEEIKELKDVKKLKEEIQKIEESVRKIVCEHILNNYDNISNIPEGETLINIIAGNNVSSSLPKQDFSKLLEECAELKKECQKRGGDDHSLDQIESKIKQKEQELLELKRQLLNYYDLSGLNHPLGSYLTLSLTIQKVEWEDRDWGKVLKITFAENIKFSNSVLNNLHFSRFAENAENQYLPEAEAFFYFISKLGQRVQIPLQRTHLDEQGFIYWVLSDEVMEEIKSEKEKWYGSGYSDVTDYSQENKLLVEKWRDKSFTLEQAQKWINAGAKIDDAKFVNWLKNTKNYEPEWITNYKEDYQILNERFKKYGLCSECNQINAGKDWCKACNSTGNQDIDQFIERYQLNAKNLKETVDWVPYENFTNIEFLAQGGFAKVYKAKWDNKWIVLKHLNESKDIKKDFLQEIANHKKFPNSNRIVRCHGISQDPKTKDYLMVMDYIKDGDLRKFLKNNQLSFPERLDQLRRIADGLKDIHKEGLLHRDFHTGNILNRNDSIKSRNVNDVKCYITDLGLCRPASEADQQKTYGVLPYMAPEYLRNKQYTQAADIYSFGIMAYEVLTGLPPYPNVAHDVHLSFKICDGLRPKFNVRIPQLLYELISSCWDANPEKRPKIGEVYKKLQAWKNEIKNKENTEFYRQYKEKEQFLNNQTTLDYQIHPSAVYTSRLLDFKNLPEPRNSKEINDLYYSSSLGSVATFVTTNEFSNNLDSFDINQSRTSEIYFTASSKNSEFDVMQEDQILANQAKRQLSLDTQIKVNQGESKFPRIVEGQPYQTEPMDISQTTTSQNWQNIHPFFVSNLIQAWQNHNFTYEQTRDWINIHTPNDQVQAIQEPEFYAYLRDELQLVPEQVLNDNSIRLEDLRKQFREYQQSQLHAQIIQTNPHPFSNQGGNN
ncbi:protein kinase [endosymbiont GvMRE of Glomus versiforme]|uniref:protein kinase n=1 Tax=endosymbiont GvMRE of Glomus versiforme TaxID=2039283 RepID=UPI000ED546DC|nr:protein kinase [endosymbiont GvMRE of Glomus versiforme]RHZ35955.1 Cdc15p [endosymbiont GvMRE of Glomus versiforme]